MKSRTRLLLTAAILGISLTFSWSDSCMAHRRNSSLAQRLKRKEMRVLKRQLKTFNGTGAWYVIRFEKHLRIVTPSSSTTMSRTVSRATNGSLFRATKRYRIDARVSVRVQTKVWVKTIKVQGLDAAAEMIHLFLHDPLPGMTRYDFRSFPTEQQADSFQAIICG